MEIPKDLKNDIWEYCKANNITNVDGFILKMLKQGFTYEKYGLPNVSDDKKIIEPQIESVVTEPKIEVVDKIEKLDLEKKNTDLYGEN